MICPGLENGFFIFQVFHDFSGGWEPCKCSDSGSDSSCPQKGDIEDLLVLKYQSEFISTDLIVGKLPETIMSLIPKRVHYLPVLTRTRKKDRQ